MYDHLQRIEGSRAARPRASRAAARTAVSTLLTLLVPLGAWAAPPQECSKYVYRGLYPGMSYRDVWRVMDGKGEDSQKSRPNSTARYDQPRATVLLHYDGVIKKKPPARLARIETRFPERSVDSPGLMQSLRDAFGPPTTGVENLAGGLRDGPAQWIDERCDIRITATRDTPDWWEPSRGATVNVEIQSLTFSQSGTLPPSDAARQPTPTTRASADLFGAPSDTPEVARETGAPPKRETPAGGGGSVVTQTAPSATDIASRPNRGLDADLEPTTGSPHLAGVGGVTEPERLARSAVRPRLPMSAKLREIEGKITLQALVLRDGSVGDVKVVDVTEPGLGLEEAAIDAVKRWRYRPATLEGQPVDALVTVFIEFD